MVPDLPADPSLLLHCSALRGLHFPHSFDSQLLGQFGYRKAQVGVWRVGGREKPSLLTLSLCFLWDPWWWLSTARSSQSHWLPLHQEATLLLLWLILQSLASVLW